MVSKQTTQKRVQRFYSISDKLEAVQRLKELSENSSAASRDLETEPLKWVVNQRANKMIVNYRRLRKQALGLAKESGINAAAFKCSDKWILVMGR